MRTVFRLAALLLVAALVSILAACAREPPAAVGTSDGLQPLLVVRHAWHTGVIVRAEDLPAHSPFRLAFPAADWLELGWGDRLYYPHPDPPWWLALRAALWPTASAVNLTAHRGPATAIPGEELLLLEASSAGIARLHERAVAALERDAAGRPIPIGLGRGPDSLFWASHEPFHLFRTCNRWTAELLRAAGLPVEPLGTVTTGDLFRQLEPVARRLRRGRPAAADRSGAARRQPEGDRTRRCAGRGHARDRDAGHPSPQPEQQEDPQQLQRGSPIARRRPFRRKR
ncbi:MAG: DUF2459 domain-containing protein [Geminicoccaceae bacterium]|nr:DUF2459 domain-containing protein [Geminicoccaceae bacterium]MCX8101486.1 DUF2459 domain-containing protein [Geminicoccaceae bacterium]MDW8370687.1 DUF2459 domain-containing protein [Geminicoccaceae bacterium]